MEKLISSGEERRIDLRVALVLEIAFLSKKSLEDSGS